MSRLLRVELTRLLCRRAVLVLLALAVVVPLVIGVARVLNTAPPSEADRAQAEQAIARDVSSRWWQRDVERCTDRPRQYGVPAGAADLRAACEETLTPRVDEYLWYDELRLAEERDEGSGLAVVIVLAILMLLVGTTFAGHDWASGSVSNQLLFETRRTRVWVAKGAVVTAFAAAVTAVVVTAYWLALYLVAGSRDLRVRDGVLVDCLQMGGRGALVAGGVALAGYALTMLFRSTVAALGTLLALGLAGGVVLAVIGVDSVWNPGLNLAAVVLDGATYWVDEPCGPGSAEMCGVERVLPLGRGAAYVSAILLAAVAASVVSFRRRDVP
ncbi:hypothetical protein MF406_18250 (plasmid) [Georgenia sp. TF02-10]|uniref:hypothetical protein n=1 Tax=Georgenia sp. TF02-10 TaxID=2917725 RepID=UPI001FA76B6B|nr:hypothetical protein [Georgenia sp. TF02-10]UNX56588.1 hypothetical protein MF406_18250 [Georgenia sp. TF02-10]